MLCTVFVCEDEAVFLPHVAQSGKHQQRVNTCDSHQFPGKYIKGKYIQKVSYTKRKLNRFGITFPQRVFTVLQHPTVKENHYIQAFPLLCLGSYSNVVSITICESHLWSSPSH